MSQLPKEKVRCSTADATSEHGASTNTLLSQTKPRGRTAQSRNTAQMF
jgi:hypothetical protein